MNKFRFTDYCDLVKQEKDGTIKTDDRRVLNFWRQIVVAAEGSSAAGNRHYLEDNNNDPDKCIYWLRNGFYNEKDILNYLIKKNPDQNWHFIDPLAEYYYWPKPTKPKNLPDLTNDSLTVEVKRGYYVEDNIFELKNYKFYKTGTVEEFWSWKAHNADYIVVYDFSKGQTGWLKKENCKIEITPEKNVRFKVDKIVSVEDIKKLN